MSEQKITDALLNRLQEFAEGKMFNASECKGKLFQELLGEGLLVSIPNGRGATLYAPNVKALQAYLASKNDAFRGNGSAGDMRAEQARETGNSKIKQVRSCKGFLVNSYEAIEASLNGKVFTIAPPEGSFVFIADFENLKIPENVVVIGVENMENFRFIQRQRKLFDELSDTLSNRTKFLFASRYPQNGDLVKWLSQIPNRYIHFGDLDLAGIHIYLTEFFAKIGTRASFLIPTDAEIRIAKGSSERYNNQAERFEKMQITDPRVATLAGLIKKYHKGYDQEGFIED